MEVKIKVICKIIAFLSIRFNVLIFRSVSKQVRKAINAALKQIKSDKIFEIRKPSKAINVPLQTGALSHFLNIFNWIQITLIPDQNDVHSFKLFL